MKIGLIIYGSLDTLSGGYLYDRQLVAALRRRGHTVDVYSMPWRTYANHLADNVDSRWLGRLVDAPVDLWLQDELNHPSLFWVNRRLRAATHAPIVTVVHHLRCSEEHPAPLLRIYRRVERAYLQTVDALLANSRTTLATVEALGIERPAHVAWPAADHLEPDATIDAASIAARALLGGPLRILFVGNVIPRKGLHLLVDALARSDAPWTLSVVGQLAVDSGYARRVVAQARTQGLLPHIRFLGRLDDAALVDAYRSHHVLAVPSYEGFGIAYLEAQRFGLPVIALTTGAAREAILDGQTGYLVEPGDAAAIARHLARLEADRPLLAGMGMAARLRYELHPTWAASMDGAVRWLETVPAR